MEDGSTDFPKPVNSSLFGLSRQVTDLKQAIGLLGVKSLKMLVLGFSLPKNLFDGIQADMLRSYWSHVLIKAVAAREICNLRGTDKGDEAFLSGLLQDLGHLCSASGLGADLRRDQIPVAGDASIEDALHVLDIPVDSVQVFTVNGALQRNQKTPIKDGDELVIFPPVGGG